MSVVSFWDKGREGANETVRKQRVERVEGKKLEGEGGMLESTVEKRVSDQTTGVVWFSIRSSDKWSTSTITFQLRGRQILALQL